MDPGAFEAIDQQLLPVRTTDRSPVEDEARLVPCECHYLTKLD